MASLNMPEIIEAPKPPDAPALASLLTVTPPTNPAGSRWAVGGVTWDPPGGCGSASRWAPCSGATKAPTSPGAAPVFLPFTVVAGYQCSTLGSPEDPDRYTRQAETVLARQLSVQMEAELWTGTLAQANGWDSPFLANGDATAVSASAEPYSNAVGLLLDALRECMGDRRGVLHMSPHMVAHLVRVGSLHVIDGTRIETVFGDSVVAGGGYPGSGDVVNARYTITTTGSSGGTFTLTATNPSSGDTETTAAINHNANAAAVASALAALSFIDTTDLSVTGGALPTATLVNFTGTLAGERITMTGTSSLNAGTLAVTETIAGGSQPDSDSLLSTIYATGPLVTLVDDATVITPTELRDVDLRTNTVTVFAEKTVLAGFDTCCHFSAQADLSEAGGGSGGGGDVDGGSP